MKPERVVAWHIVCDDGTRGQDCVVEKIGKTYRPIVIPIPSRIKGISRTSYIERLLQRAIGYNIVIRR